MMTLLCLAFQECDFGHANSVPRPNVVVENPESIRTPKEFGFMDAEAESDADHLGHEP